MSVTSKMTKDEILKYTAAIFDDMGQQCAIGLHAYMTDRPECDLANNNMAIYIQYATERGGIIKGGIFRPVSDSELSPESIKALEQDTKELVKVIKDSLASRPVAVQTTMSALYECAFGVVRELLFSDDEFAPTKNDRVLVVQDLRINLLIRAWTELGLIPEKVLSKERVMCLKLLPWALTVSETEADGATVSKFRATSGHVATAIHSQFGQAADKRFVAWCMRDERGVVSAKVWYSETDVLSDIMKSGNYSVQREKLAKEFLGTIAKTLQNVVRKKYSGLTTPLSVGAIDFVRDDRFVSGILGLASPLNPEPVEGWGDLLVTGDFFTPESGMISLIYESLASVLREEVEAAPVVH